MTSSQPRKCECPTDGSLVPLRARTALFRWPPLRLHVSSESSPYNLQIDPVTIISPEFEGSSSIGELQTVESSLTMARQMRPSTCFYSLCCMTLRGASISSSWSGIIARPRLAPGSKHATNAARNGLALLMLCRGTFGIMSLPLRLQESIMLCLSPVQDFIWVVLRLARRLHWLISMQRDRFLWRTLNDTYFQYSSVGSELTQSYLTK